MFEIVKLGASQQNEKTKAIQWRGVNVITGDEDAEDFGAFDVVQGLGLTSAPWPANDDGYAEAIIGKNVAGRDAIAFGARDTRTAFAIGKLRPGDTVVHSTGPNAAAQIQCKEEKRQVVAYTKDSDGSGMVVMLDGKNDKFQILVRGAMVEIDEDGAVMLLCSGGASIMLQGQDIFLNGTVHLPGMPPGMVLMAGPPSGSPPGPAAAPLLPVLGVSK